MNGLGFSTGKRVGVTVLGIKEMVQLCYNKMRLIMFRITFVKNLMMPVNHYLCVCGSVSLFVSQRSVL